MKVTKENAVVGLKVVLDKDSQFAGQGKDAEYGVIVNNESYFPGTPEDLWVQVDWIRADGIHVSTNYYRIGDGGKFDLNVYEVVPEYVECIKGFNTDLSVNDFNVVGKIYEVESYNPKTERLKLKGFEGSIASITFDGNSESLATDYKISNKASFEAQQNPKETLVGRYLKALVNNPVSIFMNIGEYLLITKYNHQHNTYDVTRVRDNDTGFGIEVAHLPKFEVMPVGFNPPEVKKEHSFYVKYEPDFTEDIFNKLVEWCNRNIYLPRTWRTITDNTYQSFESNRYFFIEDGTKGLGQSFGVDNNKQGAEKQLSLSELCTLIGYKQELKEESIEEDWCIKITSENQYLVKKWFLEKGYGSGHCYSIGAYYGELNKKGKSDSYDSFAKEFTLDEFKRLVLKENATEEFKVGGWVVPLNDNACHDRNIGEAYQIGTLDGSKAVRMFNRELKYDGNGWIKIKDLRKATPEEIAKAQKLQRDRYIDQAFTSKYTKEPWTVDAAYSEEYPIFAEPKKQKYEFSEVEYLLKPINQQLDLPIVKKYKKKSIINL
jgi:hypothetical protein